jgi:bromodomain adjacent to zinc finger domain protein 1A
MVNFHCFSLQPLPEPTPVGTQIPPDVFGDVLMLLEFIHHFELLFDVSETFQAGINLGKS